MTKTKHSPVLAWDRDHPMHKTFDKLWQQNVPDNGPSKTIEGELIRAVGRLVYEYCNNGNCNAGEPEYDEDDYGCIDDEIICHVDINDYYQNFIDIIEKYVPNIHPYTTRLMNLIKDEYLYYNYNYDRYESIIYNDVSERVLEYVQQRQGAFTKKQWNHD